ncbi:ferritin [Corallococcus sp. AB004]|uniref:ferritin family protein n=1 Tax=Corallococcus TaxID=83461 RepID=UPI000EA177F5|nr:MULTISPECIES: ferritin family protein [Corallococcus]NPD25235.1 ferritin [Corallococcus exiguus]NRD50841.1 ferritin [Corallococcus exiguus]RKI01828.1 ferritin [Corallococcus sp. AB038B]RKI31057.1 ferritin [Corallococcus sp. AB004]
MAGKSDTERSDVARIRAVLARELETINEYEAFAEDSSLPEVKAFFLHLAAEEKEHVSEATHMLRMLDKGQDAHFAKPFVPGHFQAAVGGVPAEPAVPAAEPAPLVTRAPPAVGRLANEPLTSLPPQRLIYGVPAPPPSANGHPLTIGSLRRGGGSGGSGGGR